MTAIGSLPVDHASPRGGHGSPSSVWWRRIAGAAVFFGPALLALALGLVASILDWQGVDQAGQVYRVAEIHRYGLTLWDSGWYGGNYPLSYSVIFPLIGALIGLKVAAVAAAVLAAWAFDRILTGYLGRRTLGSWYFAASTIVQVAVGQLTFLGGEALGLAAIWALLRGRRRLAVGLALVSALCSPLAAAFLVLICVAWALRSRGRRVVLTVTAVVSLLVVGVLALVFPGTGAFPFPWTGLPFVLLLCGLVATPLVRTTPTVRLSALLYAAAAVASFFIPNPLGGNAPRLAAEIGVPLLVCFLSVPAAAGGRLDGFRLLPSRLAGRRMPRSWRRALLVIAVPFVLWQWAPGLTVVTSAAADPSTQPQFYQPLLAELAARTKGPVRMEVVPTQQHWEAALVAPYVSLARGWERQLDVADNPIFYIVGALNPRSYQAWLVANGVSWVAVPNAPLDYAAETEARLVSSGRVPDLHAVWISANWQLWKVTDSPGLVSGPGRVTLLSPDRVDVKVNRPATLTVRVRYTSYWSVSTPTACVTPDTQGWTVLHAQRAGVVVLAATVIDHPGSACSVAAVSK